MHSTSADVLRVVLTVLGFIVCGPALVGYQAFSAVAFDEGVYENLCNESQSVFQRDENGFSTVDILNISVVAKCPAQQLQFDLMLVIFTSFVNLLPFAVGTLMMVTPPRLVAFIGGILSTGGYVLLGVSSAQFQAYTAGVALLGAGFCLFFLPLFNIAFLRPNWAPIVFPLIVGAFDFSAATMFVFYVLHFESGVTISQFFYAMTVFAGAFSLAILWILLPPKKQAGAETRASEENSDGETAPLLSSEGSNSPQIEKEGDSDAQGSKRSKAWQGVKMLWSCLKQSKFWMIAFWASWYMTSKYFYINTLNQQLQWLQNASTTSPLGDPTEFKLAQAVFVFSLILPLVAILSPISSIIGRKRGVKTIVGMMVCLSIAIAITSNIPNFYVQYVTMAMVVYNRLLFFGSAPLVASTFFPPELSNSVYGIALSFAAIVNYSQYLWAYLSISVLQSFLVVNLLLNLLAAASGIMLLIFMTRTMRENSDDTIN